MQKIIVIWVPTQNTFENLDHAYQTHFYNIIISNDYCDAFIIKHEHKIYSEIIMPFYKLNHPVGLKYKCGFKLTKITLDIVLE